MNPGTTTPKTPKLLIPTHPATLPLMLKSSAFARLLSIGESTLAALRTEGKIGPTPIKVGGSVRFKSAEVIAWITAGCPDAVTWRASTASDAPAGGGE
jgi:predicted DNA-binding transcriptional regulator AlpA